jgi:galacturonosyltransferase
MKIVLFANSSLILFKFRKELIIKLLSLNNEVIIFAPKDTFTKSLIELGVTFEPFSIDRHGKNFFHELSSIKRLLNIIKKFNPDFIFTYTIKPNIYTGIVSYFLPFKFAVNITGLGQVFSKKSMLKSIITIIYKVFFLKAIKIFVQNKEIYDYFYDKKIYPNKIEIIPGSGVNIIDYKLTPYPKNKLITFTYLGRIMFEKGIEDFLEAANLIKSEFKNVRFLVSGFIETGYSGKLSDFEKKGIIQYVGFTSNPRKLIEESSCLIQPSFYPEGISNVILEFCSVGRPVISSSNVGCGEIIIDNVSGFIYKKKDLLDLVNKIKIFLSLDSVEREKMGHKARDHIEKFYNRDLIIEKYLNLLKI